MASTSAPPSSPRRFPLVPISHQSSTPATTAGARATAPSPQQPLKRAHSSPSPNSTPILSSSELEPSPRVSRTKFDHAQPAVAVASERQKPGPPAGEFDDAGTLDTPDTPPSPAVLVGLGVESVGDEYQAREEQIGLGRSSQPHLSAQEQTNKLMAMPVELSNTLSRLCSQHHLSEYNSMKRVLNNSIAAAAPPVPQPVTTGPASASLLRSYSSPPVTNGLSTPPRPRNTLLAQSIFRTPSAASSQSLPPTRTSTPPANPPVPDSHKTGLTPTLVSFTFNARPPPSPTPPAADDVDVTVEEAIGEALEETIIPPAPVHVKELQPVPLVAVPLPTINGVVVKTSETHPMNISPILPPELIPSLSQRMFAQGSIPNSNLLQPGPIILSLPPSCDLLSLVTSSPTIPDVVEPGREIGNFFLSSCPGKKVRLNGGPSRGGRNPICRDLRMDLERTKRDELEFLGAPWPEYIATATSLGLTVVRLPMVEGFAPPSPAALDAHLEHVVKNYTLKGRSVLAHCRGGIGRAGLVASCWMLKCGFLGRMDVEGGSIKVVERVIETVRRRRSPKAIETTQQVMFLVDYVEFLRTQARPIAPADI
ncbi:protein-tyrosine/Dual-specificity phosphatase [Pseudohyphozyma bogoriensis]|nr:protein-tyrosine/Dual-specificity phosphatase [Pseudohyphozyma bogoriensis]